MNKKNIVMIFLLVVIAVVAVFVTGVLKNGASKQEEKESFVNATSIIESETEEGKTKINVEDKRENIEIADDIKDESLPDDTKENAEVKAQETKNTCSLRIVCNTILNNMDKLEPSKVPFVPENGIILSEESIEISPGESAFDVLKRICNSNNIQIEYSWTPMYNSYYVEGINQLYEFDCGPQSGWMYKVNDVFPNYGSSAYEVSNKDAIEFCYTCEGLGADVGAGF